jgi:hypothetical protein
VLRATLALALALALALPVAAAQSAIPGREDSATDGVPFEKDAPAVLAALQEVRADVSGQRIHDCVANATSEGASQYRLMGTPTQAMFVEKHKDEFAKLGLLTALQRFDDGSAGVGPASLPTKGGTNILGVLPGKNASRWVVMGGHYDTQLLTLGGGALDNASGFCTVSELARAFKAYADAHGPLDASVVFAWYDGEEWGLYGSVALAKDPSVAKKLLGLAPDAPVDILVAQSYDMPGLNYPALNTWVQYGDEATNLSKYAVLNLRTAPTHADQDWACFSYGCYQKLKERDDFARILDRNVRYQQLQREVAYDLLQLPRQYVWVYDDGYGRSDHVPFIADGTAGGRIQGSHDQEYPHYHQPTDTLPALYQEAGSKENLIAGYTTEAQAGGLAAFYVALTGDVGHYLPQGKAGALAAAATRAGDAAAKGVPVLTVMGVVLGAAIVALATRRRA